MVLSKRSALLIFPLLVVTLSIQAPQAEAQDWLCDTSYQNCRTPLLDLIRNERVGIDVAFWFMEDPRYANEIIARHRAGVRVRVLMDTSANPTYPGNATILNALRSAGIPMRNCIQSAILHWKTMIFEGQRVVEFSGANFSPDAFVPSVPYVNYVDEAIYFTNDADVLASFKTMFDNHWLDETRFADYANVTRPLVRRHPVSAIDPELNFVPSQNFASRSVTAYRNETQAIDAIIYRITDRRHSDGMIAARARGVPVRLITEPQQYRSTKYFWHSWNVDRMYAAGVSIRHRAHAGQTHQKTTLLRGQGLTIFGSSNWTSASASTQIEHNYFTTKPSMFAWFRDMFDRKWFNETGNAETEPFVPLPPGVPTTVAPASGATGVAITGARLQWRAGYWAHFADVYFGTSSNPPLVARDVALTPNTTTSYTLPTLQHGQRYYWKVVTKTMANRTSTSAIRYFNTQ
jgi:phosphatidylserine/phosphatidylglycerophosphate/cardiolipin synthase-like enzyme